MKISEKWLKTWVDVSLSCEDLAKLLTLSGLEVEAIEKSGDHDNIININITPNRGDCLSIAGIAREVASITNCKIKEIKPSFSPTIINEQLAITLAAPKACPYYSGLIIRGVDNTKRVPKWLSERLEKSGIAWVSPIVDIANYVMLELGQPLHVFDLSMMGTHIVVRFANSGEKLCSLNKRNIELSSKNLVIADDKKVLALAGIIGGLETSVTKDSRDIFIESAFFNPTTIALTAREQKVMTDACYRFERGVDPQLSLKALKRASELMVKITGGQLGKLSKKSASTFLPLLPIINFRPDYARKIIGYAISDKEITAILSRLNMPFKKQGNIWKVRPPSYRFDIAIEQDLIEEVARLKGYQHLPSILPKIALTVPGNIDNVAATKKIYQTLQNQGYHEVITYSFVEKNVQKILNNKEKTVNVANPISSDMSTLRSNLWPGLIKVAHYNLHRQVDRLTIFEMGSCFHDNQEQQLIAGLAFGSVWVEQWGQKPRAIDFFDIKNHVEQLLCLYHKQQHFVFQQSQHLALHPMQQAKILYKDKVIGHLGALHPLITQQLALPSLVLVFELSLEAILPTLPPPKFKTLSKFPVIRRDLAFIVDDKVSIEQLRTTICQEAGELLVHLSVFDVYQGSGISLGHKSIALSLILQHAWRTLREQEVNELVERVVNLTKRKYHATLRT